MRLQPLTLDDKPIFDAYAHQTYTQLSNYAFAPLYVWRDHFQLYWTLMDDYFCVFAKQGDDYFMPILPLGISSCRRGFQPCSSRTLNVIQEVYHFMLESNRNPYIARIENVPQAMLPPFSAACQLKLATQKYQNRGVRAVLKATEYLYETEALGTLIGNRYKSKRQAYNAFVARYPSATLSPYCTANRDECFALYDTWHTARAAKCDDAIYRAMLDDSQCSHRIGVTHAEALGLIGRVVRINGVIRGYTFGYSLNADTFCVIFEVTDLKIKGLAQFIYREFCKELMETYRWVNAMDDSGLENLKRVKCSYHPTQLILSYNLYETSTYLSQRLL